MSEQKTSKLPKQKAAYQRSVDRAVRKAERKDVLEKHPSFVWLWEILAFILPFLFLGFGFYKIEIYPFGEQQFLVTDLWHQYYPFFQLLHEKLTEGGSLLYSWRTGMGTNFLALMAYYCASPLNLLCVFIPQEQLRTGMMIILMLKFSFAGLFMAKFLHYAFGKSDVSITMFGVMYALCSYMMGYYWNTIWIDVVALLPLVMLGLTALVREGKYRTYVFSLAAALFSNYYIAYFICIFTVLAFFCLCWFEGVNFKTFGKRFGMITGCSLLGAGLASWILLPTFFALQLTHSANNAFPKKIEFYEAWRDIVANMLAFTDPTAKEGLPNLYAGLLPVLLLGVFLIARKIRLREKIAAIVLMVFLIVSCNMNVLNFIWHGFHFTNMLPYRFSFLFSFVLLVAAFRAFHVLLEEKLSLFQWAAMLITGAVFLWIGYGSGVQEEDHKFIISCAILGGVYLVIIFCRLFAPKQLIQAMLSAVLVFEMGTQAVNGVKTVGSSGYTSYPANKEELQQLMDIQEQQDNELFYRTELTTWYTLNDPALYYYNGVTQFSSMANENVTTYLRLLGVAASEAGNRYFYANSSPLTNMLTDVQYMMAKDGYNADTLTMHLLAESERCSIYRDQYALGLGFMTEAGSGDYQFNETYNAFEQQNALFRQITGLDKDLFTSIDITNVGHTGYTVTRNSYGNYNFTRNEDAGPSSFLKYNYTTLQDGMVYAMMKVTDAQNMDVYDNEVKVHSYNIGRQPYITPVGYYPPGEKVTLRCEMKEEYKSGTVQVYFYQLNADVLEEGYQLLRKGCMTLDSFADTHFSGTVNAEKDGCLYMSVPYEAGWTAYVDGKKAELYPIFGAMCGIDLTAGEHHIEMRYSPKGFVPGVVIAIGSLGVMIFLFVLERRKKTTGSHAPESEKPETGDAGNDITDVQEKRPENSEEGQVSETPEKPEETA